MLLDETREMAQKSTRAVMTLAVSDKSVLGSLFSTLLGLCKVEFGSLESGASKWPSGYMPVSNSVLTPRGGAVSSMTIDLGGL